MKQLTADAVVCFWLVNFLYLVVQNVSVAPDVPGPHTSDQFLNPDDAISGGKRLAGFTGNCPARCHCYIRVHRTVTDCSSNQMKHIPLMIHASTFELQLSKNKLTNLTYNNSLSKLEILNISDNTIVNVDKEWLFSLPNLRSLDVSKNYLESSQKLTFSNLSLYSLNLSGNKLNEITAEMFHLLDLLQILDLSNNFLCEISDNSFEFLVSLSTLDLSSNKLDHLKHEWFINLKNLKTLNINKNNLQQLSNVAFWGLSNLQYLDLSENTVHSVGLLSFKGLVKLENLNMSNNEIVLLQGGIFRSLREVKVIDLSSNPIRNLDGVFEHSKNLEVLYLKYLKKFITLSASSLSGLTQLQVLDLSGSHSLSHVNQYAFAENKDLKGIDISNSNLSSLSNGVFKGLTKLKTLKLNGNPWKCDCYLYWILLWLGENTNAHLLSPSETICQSPLNLRQKVLLDALDHEMECTNVSIQQYTKSAQFGVGSTALLQCRASGSPLPAITWVTPQKLTFHWPATDSNSSAPVNDMFSHEHPEVHAYNGEKPNDYESERFLLMKNGDLLIKDIERGDGGFYLCVASNPLSNQSIAIRLTLDYQYLVHIKIVSILVGMATSFGFLLLTLMSVLIMMVLKRCGVKCPCNSGKISPKAQQIRKILDSMEHYKKQQLERLRENYNFQVQRIKDNCMQQMERLRESYSSQAERLRDIRDYGTLQIDRIRENYYFQVQRVRDYSTSQIERLRENYIFQRNRIRKFSAHHLYKLRENYKLQQQHLNKILENLNIESCRNVCQRTDSIVFEPDITLENVFVPKICLAQSFSKNNSDSIENSSQISAYFTPEEAGSEVSGHESDGQSCVQSCLSEISISNYPFKTDKETKGTSNDFAGTDCCIGGIQPDVVFSNSNLIDADANETIV